MFPESTDIV